MYELPSVEFRVTSQGVTVYSIHLFYPRFVPFDLKGRCKGCKSEAVDIEYAIVPKGVYLQCPRWNETKYVQFDWKEFIPSDDRSPFIRIRSRTHSLNIPIEFERQITENIVIDPVEKLENSTQTQTSTTIASIEATTFK